MPITARTSQDDMIIAPYLQESDRAKNYYFCRFCDGEMTLVLPSKNITNHFRHIENCGCICGGESLKHIEAKIFFYQMYNGAAVLEKQVGDRIGDAVVNTTVIEIQNSATSEKEIEERFQDWNAAGYNMLWVITDNIIHPSRVDEKTTVPKWVRKLHQIYMGRVYMYSDWQLYAIHLEYVTKTIKIPRIGYVDKYGILNTISGGGEWGNEYNISRFYDKAWWKKQIWVR